MEWSDLRIFLAVARSGTLGAGARMLGISQPTMGRRLRALETALSQTLFQRTPDGFILTSEGEVVLAHAERMEEEASAISRQLLASEAGLSGPLRISCSDWFGAHILSPLLGRFASQHPNVVVELLTDSRLLNLARREADLVFRIKPFDDPEVVSRKLVHIPYGLFVAAGSAAPREGDGAGSPMITMDEAFGGMPDVLWLKDTFPRATIAFRSNNRDVQARLCAQGVGMAVLPLPIGSRMPGLTQVDLSNPPPGRDTWLGYHRDLRRLPRLRALVELVVCEVPVFAR